MTQEVTNDATISNQPPNPRINNWKTFYRKIRKNRGAMVGGILIVVFIIVALIGPYVTPYGPYEQDYSVRLDNPSADHWFGADHHGRDIFSRIIHGMGITLYIGFLSTFISAIIGTFLGIISGYYGKSTDAIIMRIMDVLLAFPGILLALAIVSVLGPSTQNVIIAVAIFSIPVFARIVRGSTLSVKKLEYIDAQKALGASDFRIIFMHIFPNITSPLIVQLTLSVATAILTASGLSFIGLGAQPPSPEWGAMLSDGRNYIFDAGHVAFFPGLMIVIVVLAFNIFGDGLRDALDPKMKS
ncbi:ABC transporter permease [Bacillus sp. JCM 19034]|uniref:ABC transporter permease n=1 Tax=Bacillus sp. JCM 19034 TaxID=1481928 RepID=UPI0007810BB4|nr:ABC transporter permease subunit [Bacillus sp. JCM 19034]